MNCLISWLKWELAYKWNYYGLVVAAEAGVGGREPVVAVVSNPAIEPTQLLYSRVTLHGTVHPTHPAVPLAADLHVHGAPDVDTGLVHGVGAVGGHPAGRRQPRQQG